MSKLSVRRTEPARGSSSRPFPPKSASVPSLGLQQGLTSAPITVPEFNSALPDRPEWIRLPKPREQDFYFGLSRSYWNLLVLPCAANGFKAPIKSISLRRPGTKFGVRLISYSSAAAYFEKFAQTDENSTAPDADGEVVR